jgi:maltooligosyltrehalose trehalohydrolase
MHHRIEIWAPCLTSPALVSADRAVPMRPGRRPGLWEADAVPLRQGSHIDYHLRTDDGRLLPDPRSRWQPGGARGPTRIFDATAHRWQDGHWPGLSLPGAVGYELHTGTFTPEGTLDAAVRRLDHLTWLGVGFVELMPLATGPGRRGWGYDGTLPGAVSEHYGGPGALQRFVDACHQRQLGVILDVVYNHLGPRGAPHEHLAPYFDLRHRTPWGKAINVAGPGCAEVRRFIVDNALGWLRDFHIDGLRLDAADQLHDDSQHHIIAELSDAVRQLAAQTGKQHALIAEITTPRPAITAPTRQAGLGMDAQWDNTIGHALYQLTDPSAPAGRRAAALHTLAAAYQTARPDHVAYLQNHDIIGNTPAGSRITHLRAQSLVRVAAAALLTLPVTPLLFMGEEWAASTPWPYFVDYDDEALLHTIRAARSKQIARHRDEHARQPASTEPMADPGSPATFEAARLHWAEVGDPGHRDMLAWYRTLIAARRTADPATARWQIGHLDERALLLTARSDSGLDVILNFGDDPWHGDHQAAAPRSAALLHTSRTAVLSSTSAD